MEMTWYETCLTAAEFLYGEFPVSVFRRLYATKGELISLDDIRLVHDESYMMLCDGEMFTPVVVTDGEMLQMLKDANAEGNPYASLHYDIDELNYLRREVASVPDLEYWIPSASQIEELVASGFIRTPEMTDLEREIVKRGGNPEFLKTLWGQISTDKLDINEAISAIISGMADSGIEFDSLEEMNSVIMPKVMGFQNHINLRARKGWQPHVLFKKMNPRGLTSMPTIVPGSAHAARQLKEAESELKKMGAKVDYSSIDSFATIGPYGERRVIKVGRNDPCPCGSGKKYKMCHGR